MTPHTATTSPASHHVISRAGFALLAATLAGLAVFEAANHGTGWWQFLAFGAGPDLALLVGIAPGLAAGQLHPRAVPLYNLLHRFYGPILLALAAITGLLGVGYLVGALAWGAHIALDRAVGYGLRTPDGFQRS
jgi:Domain of unknown function (DUF4260)